jgi:hypothetical protein
MACNSCKKCNCKEEEILKLAKRIAAYNGMMDWDYMTKDERGSALTEARASYNDKE